jgi:hypothetical protein
MQASKMATSVGIVLLVAALTAFAVLALVQMGVFVYTGGGQFVRLSNLIYRYLGYSTLFFIPVLLGYAIFFILLKKHLTDFQSKNKNETIDKIRYYTGGLDLFVTLFFAIGVLFTAWGMQNALVSTLGDLSESEAGSLGAWGILKGLVDNGILIALWTTIVGGAGGYLMRLGKYFFIVPDLNRFARIIRDADREPVLNALEAIRELIARVDSRLSGLETGEKNVLPD